MFEFSWECISEVNGDSNNSALPVYVWRNQAKNSSQYETVHALENYWTGLHYNMEVYMKNWHLAHLVSLAV